MLDPQENTVSVSIFFHNPFLHSHESTLSNHTSLPNAPDALDQHKKKQFIIYGPALTHSPNSLILNQKPNRYSTLEKNDINGTNISTNLYDIYLLTNYSIVLSTTIQQFSSNLPSLKESLPHKPLTLSFKVSQSNKLTKRHGSTSY